MDMLDKISKIISKTLQVCIAVVIFLLVTLNLVQIVTRYLIKYTIVWLNDCTILGLIIMCCLGLPWLWLERKHLMMDYADKIIPPKAMRVLEMLTDCLAAVVAVLMLMSSTAAFQLNKGFVATAMGYDESLRYLPFCISAVLWFICAVIDFIKRFQEVKANGC